MQRTLSPALTEAVTAHHTASRAREEHYRSMVRDIAQGRETTTAQQEHFVRLDRRMRETRQQAFDVFAREHLDPK